MNRNRYTRTYVFAFLILSQSVVSFSQVRTYDGFGNNLTNPEWGAAGSPMRVVMPFAYSDGISSPNGQDRPNPRKISNDLFDQRGSIFDNHNLTDCTWVFGQFIKNDITSVEDSKTETAFVSVPSCDPFFDPRCTGQAMISMMRSLPLEGSGTSRENPRQFANEVSAFIDGSAVYGSDPVRANWLRTHVDGKLKVSEGGLLPFNTVDAQLNGRTDPDAPPMKTFGADQRRYFVAGDVRANENVMLTAMHTLFVREHNLLCDKLKVMNSGASDEDLYQKARKMVGGIIQNIVYNEWLPSMGVDLEEYTGYAPIINANVSNVFSAAAFRFDQTLVSSNLLRMDDECNTLPQGDIRFRNGYFSPEAVVASGLDPLIKGMSAQVQQQLDCKVIADVRNMHIGEPGAGLGLDFVSITINLGRERGLPDYNTVREILGLGRVRSFAEITADPIDAIVMEDLYGSVDKVDPWVGMLAEEHMPGAMFGETMMQIIRDQFRAFRNGDRFYFENDPELNSQEKSEIRHTTMAYLIERNTGLHSMQENVFAREIKCNKLAIDQRHLSINVAPNPIQSNFDLSIYSFEIGEARLIISDITGKEVFSLQLDLDHGVNSFNLNLNSGIPFGYYNLQIHQGERFNVEKILKVY